MFLQMTEVALDMREGSVVTCLHSCHVIDKSCEHMLQAAFPAVVFSSVEASWCDSKVALPNQSPLESSQAEEASIALSFVLE